MGCQLLALPPTREAMAPTMPAPTRTKQSTFCRVAAAARPRMFRANSSREQMVPMMMVTRYTSVPAIW